MSGLPGGKPVIFGLRGVRAREDASEVNESADSERSAILAQQRPCNEVGRRRDWPNVLQRSRVEPGDTDPRSCHSSDVVNDDAHSS